MPSLVGSKLKLEIKKLEVGEIAPDFRLTNENLDDVSLKDFADKKYKIISTFPSINTSVCNKQTKTFNEEFSNNKDIVILNVSCDLPFAFKDWCASNNLENVIGLSDYKNHNFGKNYGINIVDFDLLYRSVFILDENNKIIYIQFAKVISDELDFNEIRNFVNSLK